MNRNNEAHFALTPTAEIGRSKFERPHNVYNTFSEGDIVPIFCEQYVPGDTIKMRMSSIVRMMTPLVPVMGDAVLDVYFFNVPWRLVWEHTKQFVGENDTSPWVNPVEYEIPQIEAPSTTGWDPKSLAVYLGEPAGVPELTTNALKFRAYACIYNNWFRSEAVQTPVYMHMDDTTQTGKNYDALTYDPITDTELGAKMLKACKTFDYFTGCLPQAQAGNPVLVPIGTRAPIVGSDVIDTGGTLDSALVDKKLFGNTMSTTPNATYIGGIDTDGTYIQPTVGKHFGLAADLSQALGATITQLRQSFQIQKFMERAGSVGQRFGEVIKGHFGVTNPDYRNMIPEYLGGFRSPVSMNQVVQTSSTDAVSPQGNTAAYSCTIDRKDDLFTKSFTEWGIIMGLAVVRVKNHVYQQGQNREWAKKKRYDFYWPEFANLSNQAVLNKEIYAQGPAVVDTDGNEIDSQAFGYQECWSEMRYSPDRVAGELRSDYAQSLDIWGYFDNYNALPTLSNDWIKENEDPIGHTLAVTTHDQFFGNFYFGAIWTRPMPVYSIPGLIDHH